MLISAFIFVMQQDLSHQLHPYPLKFHPTAEAQPDYFRFNLRRLISGFGTTSSERRLVLSPCDGIKLIIYCASIKQREHTHCCQLNFRPTCLWRTQSSLRMLTYHFSLPSNPVTPMVVAAKVQKISEGEGMKGEEFAYSVIFLTFLYSSPLTFHYARFEVTSFSYCWMAAMNSSPTGTLFFRLK